MANQNQNRNNRPAPNKRAFNWSFKEVAQKDLNANQWPFKVVRNEGKADKMECRSISVLEKSFEGTPYNLNDMPKGNSRYGCVLKYLLKHKDKVSKITHLAFGYNSIYFLIDGDPNLHKCNFRENLCSAWKVANGIDYKQNITKNRIVQFSELYKKSKGNFPILDLKNNVEHYIQMRKYMMSLDSSKPMIDVLVHSELNFSSLKCFIFLENSEEKAIDYRQYVYETLGIECAELQSIETELNCFNVFVNTLNGGKKIENLKKLERVFKFSDTAFSENQDPMVTKSLFKSCENGTNDKYALYINKTIEGMKNVEKDKKEEESKNNTFNDFKEEKNAFLYQYRQINSMISNISDIIQISNQCFDVANAVERDIWAKYLYVQLPNEENKSANKLRAAIQAEYDYRRDEGTIDTDKIYNFNLIYQLGTTLDGEQSNLNLSSYNLFYILLPTYFKNGNKTLKSMGVGFDTKESASKSVQVIKNLKKQIIEFFEVFVGCEYGILGVYMKRFMHVFSKEQALDFAIQLIPSIKGSIELACSKNVISVAERFLYRDLGYSLSKSDSKFYALEESKEGLTKYESFCKSAIDRINGKTTPLLTHINAGTDEENLNMKIQNLFSQYNCLKFIFEQYKIFFKI